MMPLLGNIKNITAVAVSGGPDSMALLSFLRNANKNIIAIYFHHGTEHGDKAHEFLKTYCNRENIELVVGKLSVEKPKQDSWEAFWRNERYKFLWSQKEHLIATAHHLDDVAETYLLGAIHGRTKLIRHQQTYHGETKNVVRPLLKATKAQLLDWCARHGVPYVTDPSNTETNYARNRVRLNIMPEVLQVNPGFLTVVRKKIEDNGIEVWIDGDDGLN